MLQSTTLNIEYFRTFGFSLLRGFFDPQSLSTEVDFVLSSAFARSTEVLKGEVAQFEYAPMMTAETPVSLALMGRLEAIAERLLSCPVIPTRNKAVRYSGNTVWHCDSILQLPSLGFLAYLEPLNEATGALCVLPGSHRADFSSGVRRVLEEPTSSEGLPLVVIETVPGDVIVFDEHLYHSSSGGGVRRQWRTDFLPDPITGEGVEATKSYFAGIFPPDWDSKYDVDRFPCYGPSWRSSKRSSVSRLNKLGVYDLADRQEDFMRQARLRMAK